jgi:hypothetical protein
MRKRFSAGYEDKVAVANTRYLGHAQSHVLPFWAYQQLSPDTPGFQAPIANQYFSNTAYRSWTTLRSPGKSEHITVDPVGMCSPNNTWSLDIWVMQEGQFFSLATLPQSKQTITEGSITTSSNLPGCELQTTITMDTKKSPAGYISVNVTNCRAPLSLFLAIRPYGVSDISPIRDITYHANGAMIVNRSLGLVLLDHPQNILCLPFSEGDTATHIGRWEQILKTKCPSEFATGYAEYRINSATEIRAWLPLDKSFSMVQDLAKPLEETQLKTWINDFKTRIPHQTPVPNTAQNQFQHMITQQLYYLAQAENTDHNEDPWDWLAQFGRLYWIPFNDPQFETISHTCLTQASTRFKTKPDPTHAGLFMVVLQQIYRLSGKLPQTDLLQKAIKIALALPLPVETVPHTKDTNPFDHTFGEGPYWLTYFWATAILQIAAPMLMPGPQQETVIQRKRELESAIDSDLHYWSQCQQLPPMLPMTPTRWKEPAIATSLLSVFPMALLEAHDVRVSNTLLTLENKFLHQKILFSRANPSGYPVIENLLLAMTYLLRQDSACHDIIDWTIQHLSPTGALPKSIHPITHFGADGTGHHLGASGLLLSIIRHMFIEESPTGCHLMRMLPATLWDTAWDLPHMRIRHGAISMRYTPGEKTSLLDLENHGLAPLDIHLHLAKGYAHLEETTVVLKSKEKRQFVFAKD